LSFDDKENKNGSIDESEVDEIIKQHLMEEEKKQKPKLTKKIEKKIQE
jgi:hypothetical protein